MVTALRKKLRIKQDPRTDVLSLDLAQLIDYLHEDMKANMDHPDVQKYIQLLLRQLELVGV